MNARKDAGWPLARFLGRQSSRQAYVLHDRAASKLANLLSRLPVAFRKSEDARADPLDLCFSGQSAAFRSDQGENAPFRELSSFHFFPSRFARLLDSLASSLTGSLTGGIALFLSRLVLLLLRKETYLSDCVRHESRVGAHSYFLNRDRFFEMIGFFPRT